MKLSALIILITTIMLSCSDFEDRPDLLNNFRPIGVSVSNPIVAEGTSSLSITAFFISPSNESPTFSQGTDALSSERKLQVSNISTTVDPLANIDLHTVTADLSLPATIEPPSNNFNAVEYFRYVINGKTAEYEVNAAGKILMVNNINPLLAVSLTPVSASISEPIDNQSLEVDSEIDLIANLTADPKDNLKISWFVTGGEVASFRAKETVWITDDIEPGEQHTVLLVARGTTSKSIIVEKIQVQF